MISAMLTAVDGTGNAYVAGAATAGFPTHAGFQTTFGGGGSDAFALTLTPAMCAMLLKPQHKEPAFFRPFNRAFAWLTRTYLGGVNIALRQVVAFDELHHEGADTAGFFEAVDVRDVRVIE